MKAFVSFATILVVVLLDQVTKAVVSARLDIINFVHVLPFFDVVSIWNHGVAFGFMGSFLYARIFLTVAIAVIMLITAYFIASEISQDNKLMSIVALSSVFGGGLSNLVDRIRFGAVFDFLDFHVGVFHWPAFNLADCAVVCGVFFLFFDRYFSHEKG